MGRKKRETPACTVRMDADLVKMAKLVAGYLGTDMAAYLSKLCRPMVERDFAKLVQKSSRRGDE